MLFRQRSLYAIVTAMLFSIMAVAGYSQNTGEANPADEQKTETFETRRARREGFQRGFRSGRFARRGEMGLGFLRGLELTDAQKEQLKAILEANKPDPASVEELRTIVQAKRNGTITPDQKERLQLLKNQAREKAEAVRAQVETILTPEQKQKIEERKQQLQQRFEERRQLREQRRKEFNERKEAEGSTINN